MLRQSLVKMIRPVIPRWAQSIRFRWEVRQQVRAARQRCDERTDLEAWVDRVQLDPWFALDMARRQLLEVLEHVRLWRPKTLVVVTPKASRGVLFLLGIAAPDDARLLALAPRVSALEAKGYTALVGPQQRLRCLQVDTASASAVRDAARSWLGGARLGGPKLDFLWLSQERPLTDIFECLSAALPGLDQAGLVGFVNGGQQRLLSYAECAAWLSFYHHVQQLREPVLGGLDAQWVAVVEMVRERRPPGTICLLGSTTPELLAALTHVLPDQARILAVSRDCGAVEQSLLPLLARADQKVSCKTADPDDASATVGAIRAWLGEENLNWLWLGGSRSFAASLELLAEYVPNLQDADDHVSFARDGQQRILAAQECLEQVEQSRQSRRIGELSRSAGTMADAVEAVQAATSADYSYTGELRTILERLQAAPPKTLCVVSLLDPGILALLCRALGPDARVFALGAEATPSLEATWPLLAGSDQQLACGLMDESDPSANCSAIERWLDGQDLDFLWLHRVLARAELFDELGVYTRVVKPEGQIGYHDPGLRFEARADLETWLEPRKQSLELARRVTRLKNLAAMVDAVLEVPTEQKSELVALLENLRQCQPGSLCVLGTNSRERLLLLCQVAAPGARILALDPRFTSTERAAYPHLSLDGQELTCVTTDPDSAAGVAAVRAWLAGTRLDFLYIEERSAVGNEPALFRSYRPLVADHGIIVQHDVVRRWTELKQYGNSAELSEFGGDEATGIGIALWEKSGTNGRLAGSAHGSQEPARSPDSSARASETTPRLLAFYLPQFHPTPENDRWWGKGFTEWTNVTKARPLFRGHHQPHLPTDLGFYDLRLPEARQAQADLARAYGIHGFCYYHYWFHGQQMLHEPFNAVLRSGEPDLPFCLCWANEPWSRRWDGSEHELLVEQRYSEEDDRHHARRLLEAFRDPRYVRVNDKLLFLVYRVNDLPDPRRTADILREHARQDGLGELLLCKVECHFDARNDPREIGFDAAIEFQPDGRLWQNPPPPEASGLGHVGPRTVRLSKKSAEFCVLDYEDLVSLSMRRPLPEYPYFPGVTPQWDNSPRRKSGGTIFVNSTPEKYEHWLSGALERAESANPDDPVVFINAWNEWAETNHLEPDQRFGRGYLEATARALASHARRLEVNPLGHRD
jgi:hypothetical protein